MASALQLVLLARLDAELTIDSQYTYTRHRTEHDSSGTREETLWRRTPRPMGKGGMGEVFREECIKGSRVGSLRAVKVIEKPNLSEAARIDYTRELEAIARFSAKEYEEWFVKSFGWFEDVDSVFISMEFVEHGDLYQHINQGPLKESETQSIISQVLKGVSFLHEKGYVHRDLKPQNLLVVSKGPAWHVKIADFGLSRKIVASSSFRSRGAGTPAFLAPEVWGFGNEDSSDDESHKYDKKSLDIWAIGVISFLLLTGELPFPSPLVDAAPLRRYAKRKISLPTNSLDARQISTYGQGFIKLLLAPSPRDRPPTEVCLQHAWLTQPMKDQPFSGRANIANNQASATWDTSSNMVQRPISPESSSQQRPGLAAEQKKSKATPKKSPTSTFATLSARISGMASRLRQDSKPPMHADITPTDSISPLQDTMVQRPALISREPTMKKLTGLEGSMGRLWNHALSPDCKFLIVVVMADHNQRLFKSSPRSVIVSLRLWNLKADRLECEMKLFQWHNPINTNSSASAKCVTAVSANTRVLMSFTLPSGPSAHAYDTYLWDLKTRRMCNWPEKNYEISSAVLSSNGTRVALTVTGAFSCAICDAETGTSLQVLAYTIPQQFERFAFSTVNDLIVGADLNKLVKVWSAKTGKEYPTLEGLDELRLEQKFCHDMAFSPGGDLLAVAFSVHDPSSDNYEYRIRVWKTASGREVMRLQGHISDRHLSKHGHPHKLDFSHDGAIIAVGFSPNSSVDMEDWKNPRLAQTVRLWDVRTGKEIDPIWAVDQLDPISDEYMTGLSADDSLVRIGLPRQAAADPTSDPEILHLWEWRGKVRV